MIICFLVLFIRDILKVGMKQRWLHHLQYWNISPREQSDTRLGQLPWGRGCGEDDETQADGHQLSILLLGQMVLSFTATGPQP